MSIPTKAINKYTDWNHKIIFNGIFHRNRNIPNIRLLKLNRTLKSQKDSEKEEHSWRHLPLRLQTTSRSCSNHHGEELAWTQTHGLEERTESSGMNPHVRGQFMKIKPGKDSPALSWTQAMPASSSFFPLAAPPCWRALRRPCSSQPGRSPVIQKPEPWRPWGDKAR